MNIFISNGGPLRPHWICAKKVTHGSHLQSFKTGTSHAKRTNHEFRGLSLWEISAGYPEKLKDLDIEFKQVASDSVSHAQSMKNY